MNKYQKAVTAAVTAGTLLLQSFMPIFAATIIISGNGTDSDNTADVELNHSVSVTQSNYADVKNDVDASATTGKNEAEGNTGGDVSIETGSADTTVNVSNDLNKNVANVDCCGATDFEVEISGNGKDSDNKVDLDYNEKTSAVTVSQENYADVENDIDATSSTGKNEAEDNTGGNVSIETGAATTEVTVGTAANVNSARVGGGSSQGGSVSALIMGNGKDSDNKIDLDLLSWVELDQANYADVDNDIDAAAYTGKNEAEDNTGGEVSIETGKADVTVEVDNSVNFNFADADCGCLLEDLLVKIFGNGVDSENEIEAEIGSGLSVDQSNCGSEEKKSEDCELDNDVDAFAGTGLNEAEDNTGEPGDDPSIETGAAASTVELGNSGNTNVYGASDDWELPGFDFNLNFSFSLSELLDLLGLN